MALDGDPCCLPVPNGLSIASLSVPDLALSLRGSKYRPPSASAFSVIV
jgi:hypothetical protein